MHSHIGDLKKHIEQTAHCKLQTEMKTYKYSDLSKTDIQKLVQRNADPARGDSCGFVEDIISQCP